MSIIDAILVRAAERPTVTMLRMAGLALPYLFAACIAYIPLSYLPYEFYPDRELFQIPDDAIGFPWFEPYFRYFTGAVEAVASSLQFIPGLQVAGTALAFGMMAGAIGFHLLTPLGITPYHDGGELFKEACTNLVFGAAILLILRHEILPLLGRLVIRPRVAAFIDNVA